MRSAEKQLGDVAKQDKLYVQHVLPLGAVCARPAHRLIDGLGPDAKRAGQRSPRLAEDLDPEVGDPRSRATDGAPATAGGHLRRRDARLPADPGDDGREREAP